MGKRSVLVLEKAVISHCYAGLEGGAMYFESHASANISASTISDCLAEDGGGLQLNDGVLLNLNHIVMQRNVASGSRGGALNTAGALGGSTVFIHGGQFVNNTAAEYGGMACLWCPFNVPE